VKKVIDPFTYQNFLDQVLKTSIFSKLIKNVPQIKPTKVYVPSIKGICALESCPLVMMGITKPNTIHTIIHDK
jgi:hypothetical protein